MCEKPAIRRQHSARYYSTKLLCFITLLIFTQNGAASSACQASERTINQNLTDKVCSSSRISTVVLQQKTKKGVLTPLTSLGEKKTKPKIFEWKVTFIDISKQSEFISFSFVVKKQAETQIFASFFPLIDNVFICSMELHFALHMLCNCQQSDPNTALNVLLRSSSFPESQPA